MVAKRPQGRAFRGGGFRRHPRTPARYRPLISAAVAV